MKKNRYLRKAWGMLISLSFALSVYGTNPIISHIFTSDPAALVYGDSVYLFTGHDEASTSATGFVMRDWHVFSSADMVNWKDHGPVLSLDDFPWAVANAWAGQCIERDGKFYWYVPMTHGTLGGFSIGVAVADNPLGPYTDAIGAALITNNMTTNVTIDWDDIDPAVFIDDDGQAYLFWGNTSCKWVKLKDNMIELDGDIHYLDLPAFTEAPWIHKYGNKYYLSYAALYPEEIHYAMSDSITGPWQPMGRINQLIDNSPTNHQSIIEFKNQWYYIYHTAELPTGGEFRRSVAIDYMFYNEDSTIMEIVQTTAGVENADSTEVCPPLPVKPHVRVNDESWSTSREVRAEEFDSLRFSPETSEEGEWLWAGPNGFTAATREVFFEELSLDQAGEYLATFTNMCGIKSYTSFTLSIQAHLPDSIESGERYIIKPFSSELALSGENAGTEDGTRAIQTEFNNYLNQQWRFTWVEDVYWKLSPAHLLSMSLTVADASQEEGAPVQLWYYSDIAAQQWKIEELDGELYKLVARHSGKCLQMDGDAVTEGAEAQQWSCNESEQQQFTITPAVGFNVPSAHGDRVSSEGITVYPNPSPDGTFLIDYSATGKALELAVIDMNGKQIYHTSKLRGEYLKPDLRLDTGMYLIRLTTDSFVYTTKLMVNKL